jgi:hypothetical protein
VRLAYLLILIPALAAAQPAPSPDPASGSGSAVLEPAPAPPPPSAPAASTSSLATPAVAPPASPQTSTDVSQSRTPEPGEPWSLRPGFFVQEQYRAKENSVVQNDQDGFRLARARVTATGAGKIGSFELSSYFEAEMQPQFSLYDAYVTISKPLPKDGVLTLDLGQMRVPISRQQLISDTRRAWVDGGQTQSIAPDRDLGMKLWYVPSQLHMLRVIGGVFNGEGRDQIQNINERYFWAGRVEITPFGDVQPYAESAFAGNWLSFAFNAGHNVLTPGVYEEKQISWGYDVSGCWRGLSGSFEYLQVNHYYEGNSSMFPGKDYHANGFVAQLNYMLPIKLYRDTRLEVGARVEEIDRDDTDPIEMAGDPNQSQRIYSGVISYYLRQHQMKIQVVGYHYQQIENKTATGMDATYPEDQILAQVTYRVE